MKLLQKVFFVFGLLLSTAAVANAAVCVAANRCSTPPCPCVTDAWMPLTLAGWYMTYSDWPTQPGWIKVCTGQYKTGYCYKRPVAEGSGPNLNVLGDLDSAMFRIAYVEFYLSRTSYLYDNADCTTGSYTTVGTGGLWYFNTLTAWNTSCLVLRN